MAETADTITHTAVISVAATTVVPEGMFKVGGESEPHAGPLQKRDGVRVDAQHLALAQTLQKIAADLATQQRNDQGLKNP